MFQKEGYNVYFKGINEGKRDEGIDLIAYKNNEVLLIQCKNWQRSQVKQDNLRIFIGDCACYIEKEKHRLKNKNIRKIFDSGIKYFLDKSSLEYLIIPYENN